VQNVFAMTRKLRDLQPNKDAKGGSLGGAAQPHLRQGPSIRRLPRDRALIVR
jgi:hypothetical protein